MATNLHADILSDLAAALAGSIGVAPTANLNPERDTPSMFEPIHGSAFDITGKGVANPVATFWTASMMLDHLGEAEAAGDMMKAIERVTADPSPAHARPRRDGDNAGRHRSDARCDPRPQPPEMENQVPDNNMKIAVIAGDGIGKETVPEGLRVLEAAARRFDLALHFDTFDFASCDYYAKHGEMMPADWQDQVGGHDAIFFGAVGWPDTVPDHVSLWGSLIQFRRQFDQYVNLRPARLMPGVPSPLAGRKPGDIDFWIVRENTEGEYSSIGGKMFPGTDREVVMQETVMSRIGVDRVLRYAFDLARKRPRKRLTSATKSNGISITMPYWDERVEEMAKAYPDVDWDKYHIDILTAHFVLNPDRFDVVVASNLFGDILSDLGPACTGTIGIAPSGNINPERLFPSLFEPVHGSAPDIAGQGLANPIGQIWAGAMMLDHLGHPEAGAAILTAIEGVLADKALRTRDLGGTADTATCGKAVADALA